MPVKIMGWDIGGAHLKAVALDADGHILNVIQKPCPLWKGLDYLHGAIRTIKHNLDTEPAHHAVTMSGELVDLFSCREDGVRQLLGVMLEHFPKHQVRAFVGQAGFQPCQNLQRLDTEAIASANWLASACYVATQIPAGLLVDIGSTTTDIILTANHKVCVQGYTDFDRLRRQELVYTGVVRTPVMALSDQVLFKGESIALMAEYFATSADVHRLCGDLPEHADQMPSADQGPKTSRASARRLARMLGCDYLENEHEDWLQLALFLREKQLDKIRNACKQQLSRKQAAADTPLIGAGVGRFLAAELATSLKHPYLDFTQLQPDRKADGDELDCADCAPAFAVASLLLHS